MKRIFSFCILLLIVNLAALGQQEPLYTNYMFTKTVTVPGFAGASGEINALFLNRSMFVGFNSNKADIDSEPSESTPKTSGGNPVTSVFSADLPINLFGSKSGLGITLTNDRLGFEDNVNVDITYAYHRSTQFSDFGFGLTFGFFNYSLSSTEWYVPADDEDDLWAQNDEIVPGDVSLMTANVGFSGYFKTLDYYLGFSAKNLNSVELKDDQGKAFSFLVPHYYLTGAYNIELPNPLFELQPTFVCRTDLAATQVDINATMLYNDKHWFGAGVRGFTKNLSAMSFLAGTQLMNGLMLHYALDINTGSFIGSGFTSHEVLVTYSFNLNKKRDQKYRSVRFL